LPELISKIPQQILPAGEKVGGLTSEAAAALGLPESTPVIQGGGDAFVALLGMGVTQLGEIGLIAGSSNVIAGFIEREVHGPGVFGAFPDALIPGLWLIEGGQVSTGSILAWFKRCFALDIQPDMVYATLDNEAAKIAPGSDGLMVLDYFQGNRTPYTDSLARGAVWGLSLHTTRAHLFRGMMEGIAYGTGHVLEALADLGCYPHRMVACGGATQSDVFMQIIADVCGIPISLTEVAEASLLGGAVLAAVGSGLYPDIPSASKEMVRMTKTFEPNQVHHDAYQFYFNLYKETYPRLKDLMHQMGMHQHRKE
jgi:ribulose kinase